MQVLDLETGDVTWRDARVYPDAGASVRPAWADDAENRVRAELRAKSQKQRRQAIKEAERWFRVWVSCRSPGGPQPEEYARIIAGGAAGPPKPAVQEQLW